MMRERVLIFGASGAGTSTLGRELARQHTLTFFDIDGFFWEPTDPPYQQVRNRTSRQELLMDALSTTNRWILAGSICGWGDVALPRIDLAIFVVTSVDVRLTRLRAREQHIFGRRIGPGGDMHEQYKTFLNWAAQYDEGSPVERSRRLHEEWITDLRCPVVRVDGTEPINKLCQKISVAMAA
jgi:adenylate kinase family enzyme